MTVDRFTLGPLGASSQQTRRLVEWVNTKLFYWLPALSHLLGVDSDWQAVGGWVESLSLNVADRQV